MPYLFTTSKDAREFMREYAIRNDVSYADLHRVMSETVPYDPAVGCYIPFASKLAQAEGLQNLREKKTRQPTLKPNLGPVLEMLSRLNSQTEFAELLTDLMFDNIVKICEQVKKKRTSNGKQPRQKTR